MKKKGRRGDQDYKPEIGKGDVGGGGGKKGKGGACFCALLSLLYSNSQKRGKKEKGRGKQGSDARH